MGRCNIFLTGSFLSNSPSGPSWNAVQHTLLFYRKTSKGFRFRTSKSTLDQALQSHPCILAYADPTSFPVLKMKGHFMPLPGLAHCIPSTQNVLYFSVKIQLIFKNSPYVPPTPRSLPGSPHRNELLPSTVG